MYIIFCDSVFDHKLVEPDYNEEFIAAKKNGFDVAVFSFEKIEDNHIGEALKYIPKSDKTENAIYRGWMMKPKIYERLYNALLQKNLKLINSPKEYQHCHYLPDSYEIIKGKTPKSVWTKSLNDNNIFTLISDFKNQPIILKDYVKSEKHSWKKACFIPDASDLDKVKSTINEFLKLRGSYLNEGLVFREFLELEFLTNHSKSGMPLTKEFRVFFFNNKPLTYFNYWDEGIYDNEKPNLEEFSKFAKKIQSNFFSMDIAKQKNGEWIIMELGDGQVSGLPENVSKIEFYNEIKKQI